MFIDLAGFTALTDTHGDDQAIAVIEQFEATVRSALVEPSELIKFIGDAAMLVFATPADAMAAVRQIIETTADDGIPNLRVGFHHGPLTWRGDDVFGATVNLASRIGAHVAGGQVLTCTATAARLPDEVATPVGVYQARGVSTPIHLVEIATAVTPSTIDPVCQMRVTHGHGAASIVYGGLRWDLCSLACARRFTADPELYLAQLERPVSHADRIIASETPSAGPGHAVE